MTTKDKLNYRWKSKDEIIEELEERVMLLEGKLYNMNILFMNMEQRVYQLMDKEKDNFFHPGHAEDRGSTTIKVRARKVRGIFSETRTAYLRIASTL